ncbi:MAG: hypothetical protein ACOYLS_01330 [Polymorphobacter sp.]
MTNPAILAAQRMADRYLNGLRLRRKRAYVGLFHGDRGTPSPDADIVLADLRDFCRARETTFDEDPRTHALLEGRREVWLRIAGHLHIDEATLTGLDSNRPTMSEGDGYDD